MELVDFMALSDYRPETTLPAFKANGYILPAFKKLDGTADEDMETAVALSLSTSEEEKRRHSEALLATKIRPTDLGPPDYLLLTEEQRKAIFSDRLAVILLQIRKTHTPHFLPPHLEKRSRRFCSPRLWLLAGSTELLSDGSGSHSEFYVASLMPPFSPAKKRWGDDLLSLSQIPGRSASVHENFHNNESAASPETVSSIIVPESECLLSQGFILENAGDDLSECAKQFRAVSPCSTENADESPACAAALDSEVAYPHRFATMVGQWTCSDANVLLGTGESIPVHRFVFAAWNILPVVFKGDSRTLQVGDISWYEMMRFLGLLYEGRQSTLSRELPLCSVAVQNLARSWGLHFGLSGVPEGDRAPSSSMPAKTGISENRECSPSPLPELIRKAQSEAPKTPVSDESEQLNPMSVATFTTPDNPTTPPVGSPQFSRDLFASVIDDSICTHSPMTDRINTQTEQNTSEETTKLGLTQVNLSSPPSDSTTCIDSHFDDNPTPCPLLKRLRLSDQEIETAAKSTTESHSLTDLRDSNGAISCSPPSINVQTPVGISGSHSASSVDSIWSPCVAADLLKEVTPCKTSQNLQNSAVSSGTPTTPLPNYREMMTPELKRALSAYGVKPLRRRQAVKLLNEIYRHLHPHAVTNDDSKNGKSLKRPIACLQNSQNQKSSLSSSGKFPSSSSSSRRHKNSGPSFPDKMEVTSNTKSLDYSEPSAAPVNPFDVPDDENPEDTDDSSQVDARNAITNFIRSNEQLYKQVLTYSPIEFDVLRTMVKTAQIRVNSRKLMDVLDEQCVTFTLRGRTQGPDGPRSTRVIRKRSTHS
ncbi:unnamed protein product [Calicophoron daubneyi]|uniref:Structure-specific endonuclease subunit SLX4 n=1 Tax=Calicophoron daubneyi TaxID=300641 RepID=A0AAV2TPK0_CALDB